MFHLMPIKPTGEHTNPAVRPGTTPPAPPPDPLADVNALLAKGAIPVMTMEIGGQTALLLCDTWAEYSQHRTGAGSLTAAAT